MNKVPNLARQWLCMGVLLLALSGMAFAMKADEDYDRLCTEFVESTDRAQLAARITGFVQEYEAIPEAHRVVGKARVMLATLYFGTGRYRDAYDIYLLIGRQHADDPEAVSEATRGVANVKKLQPELMTPEERQQLDESLAAEEAKAIAGQAWFEAGSAADKLVELERTRNHLASALPPLDRLIDAICAATKTTGGPAQGSDAGEVLSRALRKRVFVSVWYIREYMAEKPELPPDKALWVFRLAQVMRLLPPYVSGKPLWLDDTQPASRKELLATAAYDLLLEEMERWQYLYQQVPAFLPVEAKMLVEGVDDSPKHLESLSRQFKRQLEAGQWSDVRTTANLLATIYGGGNRLVDALGVWGSATDAMSATLKVLEETHRDQQQRAQLRQCLRTAYAEREHYSLLFLRQYLAAVPELPQEKALVVDKLRRAEQSLAPVTAYPVIPIFVPVPPSSGAPEEAQQASGKPGVANKYLTGEAYDILVADIAWWRDMRKRLTGTMPKDILALLMYANGSLIDVQHTAGHQDIYLNYGPLIIYPD